MHKYTKEEQQIMLSMYQEGKNTVEIADTFGTYNTSIRRILIRNGVKPRTNSEVNKYSNSNLFSGELSREEQYYLGLLITDGCIHNNRLTLSLQESDKYLLEKFAKFLGDKVKVNSYYASNHNKYQYEVKVRNSDICNNLQKLANFVDKSNNLELYTNITFDILRGIVDGDGHVNNKGLISIFGNSIKFLTQIQNFLLRHGLFSTITKSRNLFSLNILRQKEVVYLYHRMYYSTDLFLIRKKNKFGPLLKKFER